MKEKKLRTRGQSSTGAITDSSGAGAGPTGTGSNVNVNNVQFQHRPDGGMLNSVAVEHYHQQQFSVPSDPATMAMAAMMCHPAGTIPRI